jgi:hypothetical protein
MSSLWTPDGEREVPPAGADAGPLPGAPSLEDLSPEEQLQAEEIAEQMADVQRQVLEAPASDIVANHLMGFYELGAIHLSQPEPNFTEAAVAIDSMAAVMEKVTGRLGENEDTLKDALGQIRMAYVQLKSQSEQGPEENSEESTKV